MGPGTAPRCERIDKQPLQSRGSGSADQRPEQRVGVSADELGRGVQHDVRAMFQRPLQHRRGERVVDHQRGLASECCADRRQVRDLDRRIGGGLQPDQICTLGRREHGERCRPRLPDVRSPRRRPPARPRRRRPRDSSWSATRSCRPAGSSSKAAYAAAIPDANASAWPPSSAPIADSSAVQVGLPYRPYPTVVRGSAEPTYVDAKTTGGLKGASTTRAGRPAVTARVSGCIERRPCRSSSECSDSSECSGAMLAILPVAPR